MNDAIDTSLTLKNDVECILLECHRDRPGIFASSVTQELLAGLADRVAGRLGPLIGGRYVPNRYVTHRHGLKAAEIEDRNAKVHAAFTGANHAELMKRFAISRRLVYSILAQKRKG